MAISGTREWSVASINCVLGCPHRCRYCYARARAQKYKLIIELDEWGTTYYSVREAEVCKKRKKYDGTVMFPTTHDITPDTLNSCVTVLENLLEAGNDVLVVSKPHLECITEICAKFEDYKSQIMFRFTIGAMDDEILSYWEPYAPKFEERFASLALAFNNGYRTSVSAEPMLDSDNVCLMFYKLEPIVTDSIWIGKMNDVRNRVQPDTSVEEIARIEAGQTDERIKAIYEALKDEPKIRWKESFKTVLGLELAHEPGLDV